MNNKEGKTCEDCVHFQALCQENMYYCVHGEKFCLIYVNGDKCFGFCEKK